MKKAVKNAQLQIRVSESRKAALKCLAMRIGEALQDLPQELLENDPGRAR